MVEQTGSPPHDRRANPALREMLDELIDHIRAVSKQADEFSNEETEHAQQRFEWYADEVWQLVLGGSRKGP